MMMLVVMMSAAVSCTRGGHLLTEPHCHPWSAPRAAQHAASPWICCALLSNALLWLLVALCCGAAAMCSNSMARLDVANEEWHNCDGPRLSRLHAGVTEAGGR